MARLKRVLRGKDSQFARGVWLGGPVPEGYIGVPVNERGRTRIRLRVELNPPNRSSPVGVVGVHPRRRAVPGSRGRRTGCGFRGVLAAGTQDTHRQTARCRPAGHRRRASPVPPFLRVNAQHNAALVTPVIQIAGERAVSPAQIALAWLHGRSQRHGLTVVPIPATRHPQRLDENVEPSTSS